MLSNRIKYLRRSEDFDMTQAELAKKLGVSRQTIVDLEKGRVPSGDLMLRICKLFNKDVREIFFTNDVESTLQKKNNVS